MKNKVNVGVAVIIENYHKDRILMGKRNRKHSHGAGTWCTPGGHIEFGEKVEDTCKREVFEETNIKIKNIKFLGITNDIFKKEKKHYITLWFSAKYKSGIIKCSNELDRVSWHRKDKLPKPLFLCMKNYLKKINLWLK